jgi:hypothetical protein
MLEFPDMGIGWFEVGCLLASGVLPLLICENLAEIGRWTQFSIVLCLVEVNIIVLGYYGALTFECLVEEAGIKGITEKLMCLFIQSSNSKIIDLKRRMTVRLPFLILASTLVCAWFMSGIDESKISHRMLLLWVSQRYGDCGCPWSACWTVRTCPKGIGVWPKWFSHQPVLLEDFVNMHIEYLHQ